MVSWKRMWSWMSVSCVLLAAPAAAVPELVSWQQEDLRGVVGWRIYMQQADEEFARTLDLRGLQQSGPDGVFAVFIDRDPSVDLRVAVVSVGSGGLESEPSWSKVYPAFDRWTACHLDYDGNGNVGGQDFSTFRQQFGQTCEP